MSEAAILEAVGVERHYDTGRRRLEVLRGVDLRVEAGEAVAITGMSGAGKSTFLHILGGLDRPDGGVVRFEGRDWRSMGERERVRVRAARVGFVFQAYHLLPEMSVEENVWLAGMNQPGAMWRGRALRKRAAELLEQVGLGARRGHRPNELSGGEQQRVALARALMNHPVLLLADEPTGNLDSPAAKALCGLLGELNRELGCTILVVSHDPMVAASTRKVHVLKDGRFADSFEPGGDAEAVAGRYLAAMREGGR